MKKTIKIKGTKRVKTPNAPLTVEVVGEKLVISIGVSTLAYALQYGHEPFGGRITNEKAFAKDVAVRLENDDSPSGEEGGTSLISLLWDAGQSAMEWGSAHVALDGDSQPSVYPPERS